MGARSDTSCRAFDRGVLRTVRGSLKRFVALATITALGVTMLVGIKIACVDLRLSADTFFDAQRLFDVRVQSTLGLTAEDVDALAAIDGVEAAEGGYAETCYTTVGSASERVDVRSLSPAGMNEPLVLEGELPSGPGEVAVTRRFSDDSGLGVGDAVSFHGDSDGEEGSTEVFDRGDYTITAVVLDPEDINAGEGTMSFRSSGGSQYAFFVSPDAVASDVFTVVYLRVEGAEAPLCYSGDYEAVVDDVTQRVEDARAERERARGEAVRADAAAEVDEAERDALSELADAQAEIDDGQAELDDGRAEAADGQAELDRRRADALAQLDEAQGQIDEGSRQLDDSAAQLAGAQADLDRGVEEFNAALPGAEAQLRDGQAALDAAREDFYATTVADLESRRDELAATVSSLEGTVAQLDGSVADFADGLDALAAGLAQGAGPADAASALSAAAGEVRSAWGRVTDADAADDASAGTAVAGFSVAVSSAADALSVASAELDAAAAQVEQARPALEGAVSQLEASLARADEAVAQAQAQLDEVTARIEELEAEDPQSEALAELEARRAELEATLGELAESRAGVSGRLDEARSALDGLEAQAQDVARAQAAAAQLAAFAGADPAGEQGSATLASGRVRAQAALAQARAGLSQLEDGIDQAVSQGEAAFAEQQARIDAGWQELRDGYDRLVSAQATLDAGARQLADGRAELADGQAELDRQRADALAQLAEAQRELDDALAEIADGQAELDEARATLESERADALDQIAEARAEVADIEDPTWYVQDRSSLSSYASVDSDATSIEAIGTVIPVVFFVVAVLISLTTMTRMVDEERELIGLYKALGYGRGRILSKYALYALAATLAGGLVGNVAGFVVLPSILFTFFSTMYALPELLYSFDAVWALGSVGLFAVGIVGATVIACWRDLRESPASLMRPKAPKAGSRIFLEHIRPVWARLGFLNKVTARNLFRYKRRLLMTVLGIAGCVALLVTGFGIKDTVVSLSERQYGEGGVIAYDLMAVAGSDDLDDVAGELSSEDGVADMVRVYTDSVTLEYEGAKESVQLVVVPDGESLDGYVRLWDGSGAPVDLAEAGCAVTKSAEQVMGFSAGETLRAQDSTLAEGDVRVGSVVTGYLGNTVYMTEAAYEGAFGKDCEPNALLVHLTSSPDEQVELSERLARDGRLLSVVSTQKLVNDFSGAFTLINIVVYVVIVLAAALSFTVVFTLSNTNISERERELATVKVLGFRRGEVHRYINKETLILTGIGVLAGMPLGYALARSLTWILRMPSLYFDVVVNPATYVVSAGLAFAFTLLVNLMTNRTLDRIDMVGALKSAE